MRNQQPWDDPERDIEADIADWKQWVVSDRAAYDPDVRDDLGDDDGGVVVQARCLFCGVQHYAPLVWEISNGRVSCASCGRVPPVFTSKTEYQEARRAHRWFREHPEASTE